MVGAVGYAKRGTLSTQVTSPVTPFPRNHTVSRLSRRRKLRNFISVLEP
jgi:hypothetical protein